MSNVPCAAGDGKVPIAVFQNGLSCTALKADYYVERQRRLDQLRGLERAATTSDERRSWRHACRKIERAIAKAIAPSERARRASPIACARMNRAGGRRSPRAPRRSAAARAAPPGGGDGDPDPASRPSTLNEEVGHV
jgi:hypothetical protein